MAWDEESGYDPPKKPYRVERPYAAQGKYITKRQLFVLDMLRKRPEPTLAKIARLCGTNQASIKVTVNKLFMMGYVEVIPGRRFQKYRASREGRRLCKWLRGVDWYAKLLKWHKKQRKIRHKRREKILRERARWFYYYANLGYPGIDIIEMQFDQNWRWPRVWRSKTVSKIVCKYAEANNLPIPKRILRIINQRKGNNRGFFGRKDS